ncbi:MAG: 2-hydroxyacyl-CoA dehydratase [Deltaproteobacteria bacterium]|nr:2-hydroxyacyl-CoA dehydratase [Deltaproteobacteria bacterium]
MDFESLIAQCREMIDNPLHPEVLSWKEKTGGKAVGYFPVYSPLEIVYANGMLPVGIMGGGNKLDVERADSYFGSFVCSIVKSTTELALRGDLKYLDGIFFHSICDAARNLSFVFKRNFSPQLFVEYIHFPQNPSSPSAVKYLVSELERVRKKLEEVNGRPMTEENLKQSIHAYNENRRLMQNLYRIKAEAPHLLSTPEAYLLTSVGNWLPPEDHSMILRAALEEVPKRKIRPRDKIRVVLEGSFCEQPPLELLEVVDEAGCYIVDDDLLLGRRWYEEEIPLDGNPVHSLAESYINRARYSSVSHDWRRPRSQRLVERVKQSGATAVVFCIAKFCEPALLDYPLFKDVLEREGIPHVSLEFEEKMWTFETLKTSVETFVESILFD